ncbi:MAG: type II secretion system major pseudopilin GspG [Gammaproteobacteria bacterium]
MSHQKKRLSGFSLIELLVVLVILGLLAAVVGPNVMDKLGGARSKTARLQIESLSGALDSYSLDTGRYPSSSEGLKALVSNPGDASNWNGPYLKKNKIPVDPWENAYHYKSPGDNGSYDLYSLGADNAEGGDKDNADINSWE